jgi:hypothetical protein
MTMKEKINKTGVVAEECRKKGIGREIFFLFFSCTKKRSKRRCNRAISTRRDTRPLDLLPQIQPVRWLSLTLTGLLLFLGTGLSAQLIPNLGGQRAGISALTFLKIDPSPRSSSMGSASSSLTGDGFSTWSNPAGLAELEGFTLAGGNTFWVAGINHAYFTAAKPFKKIGNLALSVTSLTTGAMERRTEFQPDGTGQKFYASNTAIGLSYSKMLTDMFSYGLTVRYVNETLAEYSANTVVVDLGFLYRVDFKDLRFAVDLQSFGTNSKLKGDFQPSDLNSKPVVLQSYPAPTVFKIGISMVPVKTESQSLTVALQLDHPNDNAENIRFGLEYEFKKLLYLRAGYKINVKDQHYPTAGFGLRTRIGKHPLMIDYGVDPTQYLGWIHRVGLTFKFNNEKRDSGNVNP